MSRRVPALAVIVISNRKTGEQFRKSIKASARTADLVTQYHARHPDYFVYRINVYRKAKP